VRAAGLAVITTPSGVAVLSRADETLIHWQECRSLFVTVAGFAAKRDFTVSRMIAFDGARSSAASTIARKAILFQ
jgi:hypothetical protein